MCVDWLALNIFSVSVSRAAEFSNVTSRMAALHEIKQINAWVMSNHAYNWSGSSKRAQTPANSNIKNIHLCDLNDSTQSHSNNAQTHKHTIQFSIRACSVYYFSNAFHSTATKHSQTVFNLFFSTSLAECVKFFIHIWIFDFNKFKI